MRCEVSIGGSVEACQFQQSQLICEEEDHRCALEDLVESVSRLLYSSRFCGGLIDVQRREDQVAAEAMADNDVLLVDGWSGRIRNTGRARIFFETSESAAEFHRVHRVEADPVARTASENPQSISPVFNARLARAPFGRR